MIRPPKDDYYVLMWNFMKPMFTGGPEVADRAIERFRQVGCNGATLIATNVDPASYLESLKTMGLPEPNFPMSDLADYRYLENDFPFYVMNMCRALYWSWNEAKPIFRRQYETFLQQRDRKVFIRTPCVNNPDVEATIRKRTQRILEGLREHRHLSLLYDVRDEPSITSFILASDSCFCEHCMAKMRTWLQDRYADLAALNAEWGTDFADWDAVEPITTLEALERRDAGEWNFAPWADHRAFMNHSFARACAIIREETRAADPDALVGPAGTQCPSTFGGYDFEQLVPVCDWVEAYDFGQSVDLFRSFKPRREFPIVKTDFSKAGAKMVEAMLWAYVFQSGGYSGAIIWESNAIIDTESDDLPPSDVGKGRRPVYLGLRDGIPRLLQDADEVNSPVAVLYSHASVDADFITAAANRPRTINAYEPERYSMFDCRAAWWKLLEDRGLRPTFISSKQVAGGELATRGVKLLVLPRAIALSDAEAERMRQFVNDGGVLVADSFCGRMDEHCREREVGALDDLFGLKRTAIDNYHASSQRSRLAWEPAEPGTRPKWGKGGLRAECALIEDAIEPVEGAIVLGCSEYSDAALGFYAEHGKGKAILMNAAPLEYLHARRGVGGGEAFHAFFGHVVELAGVAPLAEVTDADTVRRVPGWRVWQFAHGAATYFGLAPDLAVSQDVLGGLTGEAGGPGSRRVKIKLAAAGHVYEAREGRYLGEGETLDDALHATATRLYAVLPYKVDAIELTVDGATVAAKLTAAVGANVGDHVFRFDVLDADGEPVLDAGANVPAPGGAVEWQATTPVPAGGCIRCRDVATGVAATA